MKLTHLARGAAAFAFAALAACSDDITAPRAAPADEAATRGAAGDDARGTYIVVFKDHVSDAPGLARQMTDAHGGALRSTYRHIFKGFAATLSEQGVEALRRNPNVAYVQASGVTYLSQTTQPGAWWGLDRIDQRARPTNGSYTYARTGQGVNVYVVDTGIETSHAEFGGRASVGFDATGGNGQDCNGHGTHVAGIVGGSTYGVAKQANLIGVRVFGCTPPGDTQLVLDGIEWLVGNHVKPAVAVMSINSGNNPTVDQAVRSVIAAGVTVVAAAGSVNADACGIAPGRVPEALNVSASNESDQPLYDAAYGSCVDLYAPGNRIAAAWITGGVNTLNGTSQAAPHAAGVAAQHLQANPGNTPAGVVAAVLLAATPNVMSGLAANSPNLMLYSQQTQTYRKIGNRWQTAKYIHTEGGLQASAIQPGWWTANWAMEPVAGTPYYRIRNRYTNHYLHAENGPVQAGTILPGWWTAMWELEPVAGHFRIRNRYRGTYLHVEYGSLQLGAADPSWLSAQWRFEDTGVVF